MDHSSNHSVNTRMGFHYYPDTKHYRDKDLQKWLPELKSLGVSWLVLNSSLDRAIPEFFIRGLIEAHIEPIIRFNIPLGSYFDHNRITPILEAYGHWGVNGVIFFDKPNARSSWNVTGWIQQDLVEQFLDQYLPLAHLSLDYGLIPIFPPLEPGGNYWDTTFLRTSLESLIRREENELLDKLTLTAYAWSHNHAMNWGAGGPDRWPEARPYYSSPGEEDQRGFRIFDWYISIVRAVTGQSCPIILLNAGIPTSPEFYFPENVSEVDHMAVNQAIIRLLNNMQVNDPGNPASELEPLPPEVVGCNFWLLAADPESPFYSQAWYQDNNGKDILIEAAKGFFQKLRDDPTYKKDNGKATRNDRRAESKEKISPVIQSDLPQPIDHYILLPMNEWGLADWHLEVIRPYVKKYHPTIGFSIQEAALSRRVTVVGNSKSISDDVLDRLRYSGSIVERITGNGTTIATTMAKR